MTKNDAYKIIDIPRSISLKEAERVYHQKCRELQLYIMPGNTSAERQKAQNQLAELTHAWNTVNIKPSVNNRKYEFRKTAAEPRTAAVPRPGYSLPRNLSGLWDRFLSLIPLSETAVAFVMAMVIILTVILMVQISKGV